MKMRYVLALVTCLFTAAACTAGQKNATVAAPPTVRLTLLPQHALAVGTPVTVLVKLTNIAQRRLLTDADLQTVHEHKIHLLLVDPTLTDYQHVHPEPTATRGVYRFTFTPRLPGGYRAWADITPVAGYQQFAMAKLGGAYYPGNIDTTESHEADAGGYHFTLSFHTPPVAGDASMGTVYITDRAGHPVTTLEPLMGAYGHIVGFYHDYYTVAHVHPMGEEPKSPDARGGPDLNFHLVPTKPEFIKLFVQVKIDGREIFAPFGVQVGKASQ